MTNQYRLKIKMFIGYWTSNFFLPVLYFFAYFFFVNYKRELIFGLRSTETAE